MKKSILVIAFLCTCVLLEAQIQTPAASPPASVSTQVGLTDISINYFRPRAKGRKIFGTDATVLVPYGKIWRTGANNGTTIKFSDDVTIEGKPVKKGEYLILSWPGATEWTISLYKDVALGGNMGGYKEENDAVKFTVKPGKLTEKVDAFTINISDIADGRDDSLLVPVRRGMHHVIATSLLNALRVTINGTPVPNLHDENDLL